MKYLVKKSFYSAKLGSHSEGEEIELTDEQVKGHLAFLHPLNVKAKEVKVETAMAEPEVERAVVRPARKKKAEG